MFSKEDVAEITGIVFGDETASHTRSDLVFVFGGIALECGKRPTRRLKPVWLRQS